MKRLVFLCAVMIAGNATYLTGAESFSEEQRTEGAKLVHELRAFQPAEAELSGVLRIRSRRTRSTEEIPVSYKVVMGAAESGAAEWETIFETKPTAARPAERLVVSHGTTQTNRYLYVRGSNTTDRLAVPAPLAASELDQPFAGSDFAIGDLGLEFLHWPVHYRLKGEMRLSKPCYVLESRNPGGKQIVRVKTWIEKESGGILIAEFYDAKNTMVKEFSLSGSSFKKVNGKYQLEKMEIRSPKERSETELKFNLPRD